MKWREKRINGQPGSRPHGTSSSAFCPGTGTSRRGRRSGRRSRGTAPPQNSAPLEKVREPPAFCAQNHPAFHFILYHNTQSGRKCQCLRSKTHGSGKIFPAASPRGEEFANSQLPALIFVRTCRATARRGRGKELTILRLPAHGRGRASPLRSERAEKRSTGKRLNAVSEIRKHRCTPTDNVCGGAVSFAEEFFAGTRCFFRSAAWCNARKTSTDPAGKARRRGCVFLGGRSPKKEVYYAACRAVLHLGCGRQDITRFSRGRDGRCS